MDAINTCQATTESYRVLALYSHLIPALATLILGVFAFYRAPNRLKGGTFFVFTLLFALWLAGDVIVWTTDSYHLVAAAWGPLDFLEISFFLVLLRFILVDLFPERHSRVLDAAFLLAAVTPFLITLSGNAIYQMNQPQCEMLDNRFLANYKLFLEVAVLAITFCIGLFRILRKGETANERIRIALIALSVVLFLGIFGGTEYIATSTAIYEINLYALFTLPVFVLFLTIAITSYGTFRLGDMTVKVLFYVFLVLAGTQFFNVQTMTDFLLSAMSFSVVFTLGIMLFRSNEREIAARHLIEVQEKELEVANKQQENLLHFISHEIKGYLTKGEAAFAEIVEGDVGAVSAPLKTLATGALVEMRKGVATVMDILDASNLKKGTVTFKQLPLDFRALVVKVVEEQRAAAYEKHLGLDVHIAEGAYAMHGDEEKIREHVIRNLIDNAIKYTPTGTVRVQLSDGGGKIRFMVQDSGVGITSEDMSHLFTEGGHGKDSIKVNVHSTGYGLFIAKQVVVAHGGKIWAESEGEGKGSRFIVEFLVA